MTLFVIAVDEPIYLVPYIRRVIDTCGANVVGVAELRATRSRVRPARALSLLMLGLLIMSPRQLAKLAGFRLRELVAAAGLGRTRHRLADMCRELAIPFRRIESANDPHFIGELSALGVDVVLNQTGELLREPLLTTPRLGVINRHLSLLPAYRGAWPIFWQFANREPRVGVTIHMVDRGLDTGDIVTQAELPVARDASMAAVVAELFERSVPLTCEALRKLAEGQARLPNASAAPVFKTPSPIQLLRYVIGLPVSVDRP